MQQHDDNTDLDDGGVTVTEWLIKRARKYWDIGQQIPMGLLHELAGQGLDVPALEHQYLSYA